VIRCLDGSRAWHGLVEFFAWLVAVPGMVRLNFWLCGSSLSALSGNRLRHCTDAVLALQWGLVSIGFVASGEYLGLMSDVWVKDCVHRLGDGVLFVLCRGHHSSLCVRTGGARCAASCQWSFLHLQNPVATLDAFLRCSTSLCCAPVSLPVSV
jgi:hypothetical protein